MLCIWMSCCRFVENCHIFLLLCNKMLHLLLYYVDCHDLNLGFTTKAKAWKGAGQECNLGVTSALLGIWDNEPTNSQVDSHFGGWNPYGIPNLQRDILGVIIHWIKKLFIPLEKYWNFNVWNDLHCRNPSFGLATKAKGLQGCGPKGSPGVTSETPGSAGECEGLGLHTPKQLPLWEMESRWTPETSETDLRGQISMACGALYINGKLLKLRCLKWACIAHLDIWNTSYDQKKGRESNFRESASFDSRPLKVGNRPEILSCKRRATYCWKALNESYNFALDRTSIWGLLAKLWGSKVPGVPHGGISGLPGKRAIWM
jgi:hypothetical protein